MPMSVIPSERIEKSIFYLRGHKVILDADIAVLYGVPTKALVQAIKRNMDRFPEDFLLQLTEKEAEAIRQYNASQGISHGGRRYAPYALTEQGVAMLSSVLRSPQAIAVNIEIMRTFVKLRQLLSSNEKLSKHLAALEKKYDDQFRVVFDAIRELMEPVDTKTKRRIGF